MRAFATAGRLVRAVAACAALAAATIGVPVLLKITAGWPLGFIGWTSPGQPPTRALLVDTLTSPWTDSMIYGGLATLGWLLWALFIRDLILETVGVAFSTGPARQRRRTTLPHSPIRWLSAVLIGAIVGAIVVDSARAALGGHTPAASAADIAARHPAIAVAAVHEPSTSTSALRPNLAIAAAVPVRAKAEHHSASHAVPSWARDAPGGVHHVVEGDNLWDIAQHQLGDHDRWREIYVLNRHHPQANGYALTDPNEIHIGWTLALPARHPAPSESRTTQPGHAQPAPGSTQSANGPHTSTPPGASAPAPTPTSLTSPAPTRSAPAVGGAPTSLGPDRLSPSPSAPGSASGAQSTSEPGAQPTSERPAYDSGGITMPPEGWISLGLAASIAATGALLRLNRRRHQRLGAPIAVATGPAPTPVPEALQRVEAAGRRDLDPDLDPDSSAEQPRPASPPVPAPVGVTPGGGEISLLDLPAAAITGPGAEPVARAVLASALATGVLDQPVLRPVVVTTARVLARLLPEGAESTGLDPDRVTFDGERLIVLAETGDAVTHAEEEMILRRRLLDHQDAETIADLNRMAGHAEIQPAYVLLVDATDRHRGRLAVVAATAVRLDLHVLVLGHQDDIPALTVATDGVITDAQAELPSGGRLSTLAASDLPPLLHMIADSAARPEEGTDLDLPANPASSDAQTAAAAELVPDLPAASSDAMPAVRLVVLGPVTVSTERGLITTGMRSGSYAVLAVLAAHPHGRTLDQIAADLHPDTSPAAAINRLRTDITTGRRVLRAATDLPKAMFIVHDPATSRYRLDPDTIGIDLWQMLAAIGRANTAPDDHRALTALREAADLYGGDFAANQDRAWVTDYQTTHRNQILNVYSRIAEILEADQPDAALAALDQALTHDPVNEELYQRIMRVQGRQHRPDAVRRTMRRLENQLAELGGAEPSEATRRVAARQLRQPMSEARS